MKKNYFPRCEAKGLTVDIKDDVANVCEINGKRVDIEWGPEIQNETDTESIKFHSRETLVDASHGGYSGGAKYDIVEWIKFVHELKTWDDAKSHCETMGGKLFSNVDGTAEQLDFFLLKMNYKYHW